MKYIVVLISLMLSFNGSLSAKSLLTSKEANELIKKEQANENFIILDVRRDSEYKSGHINKAILIDFYAADFSERLKNLSIKKTYMLYCRSGRRSGIAFKQMSSLGHKKIYDIKDGINAWLQNGFDIVK